ncbi:phosphatase PAP2 family protein [Roseospira navarrensis]|uniref:Phosphatase PAP2 family protein n=1 Tax=Roseospira navarrensis TaxID=140058 RepID=A0A7X1ZD84_9PROT|nr:phosphatase PAP2 family protein [Roseospira navarrensis]MQX36418.1 phosphatase PAP2 family protein [Roseospira navarrensis]
MSVQSWDPPMLAGWRCRVLFAVTLVLIAVPQIDLGVSALFHDPDTGLFVQSGPVLNLIRKGVPPFLYAALLFVTLLWLGDRLIPGPRLNSPSGRQVLFLASSLAIGPGLIVNGVLKEGWGRARPSDILPFGGEGQFTPAWMMTDQCPTNCAFVSGHAAMAFWVVAFALLAPRPYRVWAVVAALVFGTVVSLARVVVGAHFLSDVLFAGVITVAVTVWLHRQLFIDP